MHCISLVMFPIRCVLQWGTTVRMKLGTDQAVCPVGMASVEWNLTFLLRLSW